MSLTTDGRLLFATRFVRLFAYGALSVVLVLYLVGLGLSETDAGLLLTATLFGDALLSLFITTRADRAGRRRMLIIGALLMVAAGIAFAMTRQMWLLVVAGTIGVISPSGQEVGPFLSIEQAALSQVVADRNRTQRLRLVHPRRFDRDGSWRARRRFRDGVAANNAWTDGRTAIAPWSCVRRAWASCCASVLARIRAVESAPLRASRAAAIAGGAVRWSAPLAQRRPAALRPCSRSTLLAAVSSSRASPRTGSISGSVSTRRRSARCSLRERIRRFLGAGASRLASRIGLVNTMVATHLPSNVLLMLVPLMPTFPLAVLLLLLRFSISQMDVPTRQSYIMAVVVPEERAAASALRASRGRRRGHQSAVRRHALSHPSLISLPFFIAGTLKIVYDLLLYRAFRARAAGGGRAITTR